MKKNISSCVTNDKFSDIKNRKLYDLTNPQKSIWLTEQFYSGSTTNTICGTTLIHELVNFDKLKQAINIFVRDNDSFRLRLVKDYLGETKQYISDFHEFNIDIIELNNENDLLKLENQMVNTPFDFIDCPLYSFILFKFKNGNGGFICTAHHLICDACTAGLLASKTINIYSSLIQGQSSTENATSYINYINSENDYLSSDKYKKDKQYWESVYETIPEIGTIPSIKSTTNTSSSAIRKNFIIDKNMLNSINSFCKENRVSIFNFFMAVYAIYISKVSNLDNFVLGTPILNRTTFVEKNTPGMFISTVPFRFNINNEISFLDFVKNIAIDTLIMFRHQKYPYQNILQHIRSKNPSQPNLYDILISYQNTKTNKNSVQVPYNVKWTFNNNVADSMQIHLFDMNDEGLLNISYDYRLDKYDDLDITNIHNRICYIIKQVLNSNQSLLLQNIDITPPEEKNLIFNVFNNTYMKYNSSKTIIDYFEDQVRKTPNKTAIVFNGKSITYNELNEKSNMLANHLIQNGIKSNDIVSIMLHRSLEMIIAIIAILKTGAAYLPLDPEYPADRINYILNDSNSKIILLHTPTLNSIDISNYKTINIDLTSDIYKQTTKNNIGLKISPNSLIYMIYTSGSTGNPKGVMVTHQNINNFVIAEKKLIDFSQDKVMISVTTICFDIFALELWCSLTSGMKLVLASDLEQVSPESLRILCLENNVSMIQTTPSRYSAILEECSSLDFVSNFTDIMVGGEPFPKKLLAKFHDCTNAHIFNMYGPTETTVWSTFKDLTSSNDITIGKPIGNTTCYILDKNKNLLPIGVPGELYIGGDGVTKGYWNRNDLTSEKFIVPPFDLNKTIYNTNDLAYFDNNGELVHLGRTDFQVKIRGYRIELEEIQTKLLGYKGITNCVIVSKDNKFLICYYVADKEYSSSDISTYLLDFLPNYMIPAYFIKIDSIPLTPNGKLNRHLLPELRDNYQQLTPPSTDTEKKIANVLSEILGTLVLDINTPFLNLGLDSLGIIKAQTLLLRYNFILTTQDFYKYANIRKLANRIDTNIYNYHEQDIPIPAEFKHHPNELTSKLSVVDTSEDILNNVFLTGANGFVGIHILYELIESTNNIVFCLVRGNSYEHSLNRLIEAYKFYFNKDICDYINKRIYVISGDIDAQYFGIDIPLFNQYINKFSTVIHTAAIVKHYGSFEDFEKINIQGTKNVVEFAYAYKKRIIHISSISVSGNYLVKQNNKNINFSENSLYIGQHYSDNVYVHSKFEAERIVLSYMQKGLTGQIHRIGILAGRYSDGVFQEKISKNAFYSRIKSMVALGAIPEDMLEQEIEFTPADYCAKAIVALSKNQICNNKIFNLYNNNLIKVKNLVKLFENFDINVKIMSKEDFNKYLHSLSLNNNNSSLGSIINDLSYDSNRLLSLNYDFTVNIKSDYTRKYLHLLNFNWPTTDEDYINKLLSYMKKVDFI